VELVGFPTAGSLRGSTPFRQCLNRRFVLASLPRQKGRHRQDETLWRGFSKLPRDFLRLAPKGNPPAEGAGPLGLILPGVSPFESSLHLQFLQGESSDGG
jgi:hypothetical protein